ncbi:uncharacterized protein LOC110981077 [Acanthaster planci]|uniref:Uncharacterized protein LOC110981077 n=1 Tax=Acanthaster planci TaxID=133434 RepID=A0A8B7YL58_ACAPL|nr:uncharacterized protein LOC110981077 [Acanthaster planci]
MADIRRIRRRCPDCAIGQVIQSSPTEPGRARVGLVPNKSTPPARINQVAPRGRGPPDCSAAPRLPGRGAGVLRLSALARHPASAPSGPPTVPRPLRPGRGPPLPLLPRRAGGRWNAARRPGAPASSRLDPGGGAQTSQEAELPPSGPARGPLPASPANSEPAVGLRPKRPQRGGRTARNVHEAGPTPAREP